MSRGLQSRSSGPARAHAAVTAGSGRHIVHVVDHLCREAGKVALQPLPTLRIMQCSLSHAQRHSEHSALFRLALNFAPRFAHHGCDTSQRLIEMATGLAETDGDRQDLLNGARATAHVAMAANNYPTATKMMRLSVSFARPLGQLPLVRQDCEQHAGGMAAAFCRIAMLKVAYEAAGSEQHERRIAGLIREAGGRVPGKIVVPPNP